MNVKKKTLDVNIVKTLMEDMSVRARRDMNYQKMRKHVKI